MEGLMTGLDTGYFVKLLQGHEVALSVWREIVAGEREAVSVGLCLFELERLGLRGVISHHEQLIESIPNVVSMAWICDVKLTSRAARLSHGNVIPAMDSLILAGLEGHQVTTIYTTDVDFVRYPNSDVSVVILD